MSTRPQDVDARIDERLERLYELREELKTIANSDVEYAEYASNGLERLQEAGYDV